MAPAPADIEVDVLVVGSGGAGLAGAATASALGRSTLVVEKTGYWGGTTAYSGGGVWIPDNPLMREEGVPDSLEAGRRYLDHIVSDEGRATSAARKDAFLELGPEMVRFLRQRGFRWCRAETYPDYYPDAPGGTVGRSIEGQIVDGAMLGPLLATLRKREGPPLATQTRDFAPLTRAFRSPSDFSRTSIVLLRTAAWKARGREPLSAGLSLVAQLMAIATRYGTQVRLRAPVAEPIVEDGRVIGAVLRAKDGAETRVLARRGVLLAAGGFARDGDFRRQHQPAGDEWSSASRGDTGDMVKLGIALGADTALMDDAWWGPAFVSPEGARQFSVWERSMPGAIIVDQSGQRYVNESASYVDVGHAILERDRVSPAIPSWLVMDARHRRRYAFGALPPAYTPRRLVESGFVVKASSVGDLARQTGIDEGGLRRTLQRFNAFARAGVDEDFWRGSNVYDNYYGDPRVRPNPNLAPIDNVPFWAVRVFPGDLGTKGGLVTDEHGRVLRADGSVIDGLYAAGNTTATVMGRTYPGPGGTLGPAMVFAYAAGLHMHTSGD
jgi:3-oxosteroid 1-dehydrogenase